MVCSFSPIAFYVLGFPIHWYSLAYIFGIMFAFMLAEHLSDKIIHNFAEEEKKEKNDNGESTLLPPPFKVPSKDDFESFLNYAIVGIVVGGRLGHVIFYDLEYYSSFPMEIFKVWKGGMSFFGGFIGSVSAAAIFCYFRKISLLHFADLWSVGVPIGLFFGRVANFINGELLGKENNTIAWAVVFKDGISHHPSQLYEALSEGVVLFCIMLFSSYMKRLYVYEGALSGIFCTGYGVARFICEFFREPDSLFSYDLLIKTGLNLNQYMSVGIFVFGVFLLYRCTSNNRRTAD